MAYFDNAATSFPKPESVYDFMDNFYRNNGASAGRGSYKASVSAGALIAETRGQIQSLLHCPLKQVIFTPTATIALNMVLQGLLKTEIRNVYISPFEHNAVTRTLHYYEKQGTISVHIIPVSQDLTYDLEKLRYEFESLKPDLVVVSHASNVCGLIAPVEDIFRLAKQFRATTVVDMAQTAGLVDCNVGLNVFDFAVFAGHKTLYGPTGISGFVMNPEIELPPFLFGGTGYESANQDMPNDLPERYEMGTLNVSGLAGLHAALSWIESTTIEQLRNKESENRKRLLEILEEYWFVRIIGNNESRQFVGIVSFLIDGISSDSAASVFNDLGISVRTGLQCAPLAHDFFGTKPAGTIRLSVSYFTSDDDFRALKAALDHIEDNL